MAIVSGDVFCCLSALCSDVDATERCQEFYVSENRISGSFLNTFCYHLGRCLRHSLSPWDMFFQPMFFPALCSRLKSKFWTSAQVRSWRDSAEPPSYGRDLAVHHRVHCRIQILRIILLLPVLVKGNSAVKSPTVPVSSRHLVETGRGGNRHAEWFAEQALTPLIYQ